ncbi:MAG: double zinc ribbon domain-containing protein [Opitutaceae bacterium]
MSPIFQTAAQALADVFFARSCVHCNDATEGSDYQFLCESCSRELFLAKSPTCHICGYPFYGVMLSPRTCPHCAELNPIFDQGKTLFLAKGPARSIIHELKYQSGFYVLKDLQRLIAESPTYLDYIDDSILVPVPLHPTKQRERGYNQSEKIADMLSLTTEGRSVVENLLTRHAYTQTQTRLNREQRHQNVKNAFALTANAVVIPDQQYILVDDVFTTGSTLNACASVLHEAGATRIKVVTLGHG